MEKTSVATMARGAVLERFDFEIEKALNDIADINKKPEAVRKVTLGISFKPFENKKGVIYSIVSKVTLAPLRAVSGHLVIQKTDDGVKAFEVDPNQMNLMEEVNHDLAE